MQYILRIGTIEPDRWVELRYGGGSELDNAVEWVNKLLQLEGADATIDRIIEKAKTQPGFTVTVKQ